MDKIGLLDIGLGNIRSVFNAVYEMGFDPVLVSESSQLDEIGHLILPGVGNFSAGMNTICAAGMQSPIQDFVSSGRPILGICLGMQLLASIGYEGGETPGLGFIAGEIVRIPDVGGRRIPHVGWNEAVPAKHHPIFDGVRPGCDFYFVHSYHFLPNKAEDILATTDYMGALVCAVAKNNLVGLQFHPEKSQANGLKMLENFCGWDGQC